MSELSLPLPARVSLRPARLCTDAQLAARAAHGDRRAFGEIFERYHQAVYRYCRSILANSEDAADALQNTMAAVLRGLDGETREIALKAWVFRVAHNEALSIARRRRPRAELDDAQPCPRSSVESDVLASERLREMVSDVQALPERQRGALVMRELNGLEYAEIAAVFEVAEGAARQAVYEARSMLQEFSEGRAMACVEVRELISARDGRLLRGRKVRAHLRACEPCSEFRAAIGERKAALASVAPPLAPALAISMLHNLLSGAGNGGATAAAAAGGAGASAAGAAAPIAKSAAVATLAAKATGSAIAVKAVAVLAATATLTGGAVVAEHQINAPKPAAPSAHFSSTASPTPLPSSTAAFGLPSTATTTAPARSADRTASASRGVSQAAADRRNPLTPTPAGLSRRPAASTPGPSGPARPGAGQPAARRPASPSTPARLATAAPVGSSRQPQTPRRGASRHAGAGHTDTTDNTNAACPRDRASHPYQGAATKRVGRATSVTACRWAARRANFSSIGTDSPRRRAFSSSDASSVTSLT